VNRVFNVSGFSLGINIMTSKLSRKKIDPLLWYFSNW